MAIVESAVSKPTFWQLLADKFRSAFLSLGLPVIGIVLLSITAAAIRNFF